MSRGKLSKKLKVLSKIYTTTTTTTTTTTNNNNF